MGVTPAPCGDAVNDGNGCIYVGVISDLTDGPFAALAVPLTEAQEDFWAGINADGGLDGWDVIISAENKFDSHYSGDLTVQGYESMRDRVALMAQTLGTPQLQAALPRMVDDDVVTAPATWWSGWAFADIDSGNVLESGAPYCLEAMNGMSFVVDQMGNEFSWALVAFPGDYGGDYASGALIAAAQLGLPDPVAEILQIPFSVGGTADEAVATLAAAAPNVIVFVTGPNEMATIVGGLAGVIGPTFRVLGAAPTWNVALLGIEPLVPLLQGVYWGTSTIGGWTTDSDGHAAIRAAAETNERAPNSAYIMGWVWQYPILTLLNQSIASSDLTRANISAIARNLDDVDYQGILPNRTYQGSATDHVERSTVVSAVDPTSPDGMVGLTDSFVSPVAADFDLAAPCFVG